MTDTATVSRRVVRFGLETRDRHDGNGVDVYDRTSGEQFDTPTLIGHITPVPEGHEAIRARGELEAVRFATVSECLEWLAEPLSLLCQQRIDNDIAWLHATVGQMNERPSPDRPNRLSS